MDSSASTTPPAAAQTTQPAPTPAPAPGQVFSTPPPSAMPKRRTVNLPLILGFIVAFFLGLGFEKYHVAAYVRSIPLPKIIVEMPTPTPAPKQKSKPTPAQKPAADSTENWKTYVITPDKAQGYENYQLKLPPTWIQLEHSSNFQARETFQDAVQNPMYTLSIVEQKNVNTQTGKPFVTYRELTGFPYDVQTATVAGQQVPQPLPRGGAEHIFEVLFFSEDKSLYYSITLTTPRDGSKIGEGEQLFIRILSTFAFVTQPTTTINAVTTIQQLTAPMQWSKPITGTLQDFSGKSVSGTLIQIPIPEKSGDKLAPLLTAASPLATTYGWKLIPGESASGADGELSTFQKTENGKNELLLVRRTGTSYFVLATD